LLDFVIIDVRTAAEFDAGYIAGAINVDYESAQFTADIGKIDMNKQYLVYCRTGVRGEAATQIMLSLGFKQVQNMDGGITAWIEAGYPVITPTIISTKEPVIVTPTTMAVQ
jgi:rhodanese-related sulfurtransferase